MNAELKRRQDVSWRRWEPYLSERAWGTVREDYSADGDAWSSFPHDHARSPDGQPMEAADWSNPGARAAAVGGADGLLLVNAWWEPLSFRLPDDRTWAVELDTADPTIGRLASGTIELARSLALASARAST